MATKEKIKRGKPESLQNQATTMALAILVERIRSLQDDDKNDLYLLMKELPQAETNDDVQEIADSMLEILDQKPINLNTLNLGSAPGSGLKKWIDYVGGKIRDLRIKSAMTQEDLANKSGLPQSHISRLESGKHSPSQMTLEKIARALNVELSDLDPSA